MAEINNEQTTEAISVVLISIDSVPSAHLPVKKNLTAQEFWCKAGTQFSIFLKCDFGISNNRTRFLNP